MLSQEEFYENLRNLSDYEGDYWERLEGTMSYSAIGWAGPIFLFDYRQRREGLSGIGKRAIFDRERFLETKRSAFEISGIIGDNLRIVDDLLDGDGCEPVENRSDFLDNYISVVETGEVADINQVPEEDVAYSAALMFNEILSQDQEVKKTVLDHLNEMASLVEEEDKSNREDYLQYANAAGREYGKMLMSAFGVMDGVSADEKDLRFAGDYGFATQVADDKYDDDLEIDDDVLEEIYYSSLEKLAEHKGIVPTIIPYAGSKFPQIYNLLIETNKRLFDES